MALLYGDGHAYGRPLRGTLESVEQIDRAATLRGFIAAVSSRAISHWSLSVTSSPSERSRRCDRLRGLAGSEALGATGLSGTPASRTRAPSDGRRVQVVPMMNKSQADIAYGFTSIPRRDPAYYRVHVDEQHPGPVRAGRPAWRQHPRATGDGVLRLQLARCQRDSRAADGSGRRQSRERGARGCFDRQGAVRSLPPRARPIREIAESKQYLIGSMPRTLETNVGHRDLPADDRVLRSRARLRRAGSRPAAGGHS